MVLFYYQVHGDQLPVTEKLDGWRLEHTIFQTIIITKFAQKGIDYYNQICGDINKHNQFTRPAE